MVVIRDTSYDYIFMHMHSVNVTEGQVIYVGEQLGTVGTTGSWSTGNHLHIGITVGNYQNKQYVDPLTVLIREGV